MKYIDADRLIAEIEKLLAKAKNDEEKAFAKKDAAGHLAAVTKTAVCVKIKKLIASLQQENTPSKEEVADRIADWISRNPDFFFNEDTKEVMNEIKKLV